MTVGEHGGAGRRFGAAIRAVYGWMREAGVPTLARTLSGIGRFAARAPIRFLAYLLLGFSFLFMILPGIDLAVSGWFASAGGGFPHSRDAALIFIRDVNRVVPTILLSILAAAVFLHAFRPGITWLARPYQALFVISVYALGSGLIVHILKNTVGRARPEKIAEFGGTEAFSVAWQISDACARNCSFSSGEAGSAMAMMSLVLIMPPAVRLLSLAVLLPLGIVFSLNRIAFGSHFISDVVVSWIIVLMVMIALWRVFRDGAERIDRAVIGSGLPLSKALRSGAEKALALVRDRSPSGPGRA